LCMGSDSDFSTREICRSFRKNPTKAEALLWDSLRNRSIGKKFRRQYPTEGFILDFYCPELKICIEIDGQIHKNEEQLKYDQERSRTLKEQGISILRFWNSEVLNDLPSVLKTIDDFIRSIK